MGNTTVSATGTEDEDDTSTATTGTDSGTDDTGTEADELDEDDEDPEAAEAAILAALPADALALFEKTRDRLAKANASSSNRRKIIQQMRKAGTPVPGQPPKLVAPKTTSTDKPEAFDPEAFKAALLAELQTTQQAGQVERSAESKLRAAGLTLPDGDDGERKLARVMRMVDWTAVAPDEVADEVADLKRDHPELFRPVRKKTKTGGVGGPAVIKGGKATKPEDDLFD